MVEEQEGVPVGGTPAEPAGETPSSSPEKGGLSRETAAARKERPALSPGILVSEGLKLGFRNFFTFFFLALLCNLPLFVSQVWVAESTLTAGLAAGLSSESEVKSSALLGPMSVTAFITILVGWFTSAVLVFAAVRTLSGEPPSLGEAISKGFSRFPAILWVSFLVTIFTTLGMILFIVPGIVVAVMLSLALPVTVLERKSGMEALRRSARLTSGYKMDIFLAFLVLGILFGILNYIWATVGVSFFSSFLGTPKPLGGLRFLVAVKAVLGSLSGVVFSLFSAVFTSFAYVRLKEIKEGVNLRELVKVFR